MDNIPDRTSDSAGIGNALARRTLLIESLKATVPSSISEEILGMQLPHLRMRLVDLDSQLKDYKKKFSKKENESLQEEIECTQRDFAEYTAYLFLKRAEKQTDITGIERHRQESISMHEQLQSYRLAQQNVEEQNLIQEIARLEKELNCTNDELVALSDVLYERQLYEKRRTGLTKSIELAEAQLSEQTKAHESIFMADQYRTINETKLRINAMQVASQNQAHMSLVEYTSGISESTKKLARELKGAVLKTQNMYKQQASLELECCRLEQMSKVKERTAKSLMRISEKRREQRSGFVLTECLDESHDKERRDNSLPVSNYDSSISKSGIQKVTRRISRMRRNMCKLESELLSQNIS